MIMVNLSKWLGEIKQIFVLGVKLILIKKLQKELKISWKMTTSLNFSYKNRINT